MNLKKQLKSISISRLITYLVIISLFPLIYVGFNFLKRKQRWESVSQRIEAVRHLAEIKTRGQSINHLIREEYADSDPFYIDTQLESLSFLNKEKEALEKMLQNTLFTGNEWVENRYTFITSEGNRIRFTEGDIQKGEGFQESITTILHPVEGDIEDLKEFLARIETYCRSQPQMVVTDFTLNRKTYPSSNEVYELTVKILKREFIK